MIGWVLYSIFLSLFIIVPLVPLGVFTAAAVSSERDRKRRKRLANTRHWCEGCGKVHTGVDMGWTQLYDWRCYWCRIPPPPRRTGR